MNDLLLLGVPIVLPMIAAAVHAIVGWRTSSAAFGIITSVAVLADAIALASVIGDESRQVLGGFVRADALSAWLLLIIATIALLACWASPAYLASSHTSARSPRSYAVLLHSFIAAMTMAVLAGNLGMLWVAVEATTIVTAFLVGHHRTRTALEAAWKYVVICSAAIAIAFLGTVLMYYAARHAGLGVNDALDWASLAGHAGQLDPAVTRMAIGLVVLGFGAKAGLVPLHAWLPDAHSQAPAPISALMSGVLLSVGFYAVLRFKVIADGALGQTYVRTLLLILALATLAAAAVLLIGQRDYKRMLAYSSMEHMGLIALGAAVGSRLAIAAVLIHMAGHGLAKTAAFLSSGHILAHHRTADIDNVRALAGRMPLLATTFGLAVLALLGFPPAATFASELGMVRAGIDEGLGWAMAIGFALAAVAFAALIARTGRMLLSPPAPLSPPGSKAASTPTGHPRPFTLSTAAPMLLGLLAVAALGLALGPLGTVLHDAAAIIGGS